MAKKANAPAEECYEHILQLIMTKELMPGDKIPETKIAQDLGISRTPVRDGMKRLANEGIIDVFPNRFAQVKNYTLKEIQDVGTLRIALDSMAVKLAIIYGNQLDYINLQRLAEECERAAKEKDNERRRSIDCDFHLTLADISKNELLIKFQRELYIRVQFIMLHHPNPVKDEVVHLKQHFEIVEALNNHEEERAVSIIQSHLSSFYQLKQAFPENFFNIAL